MWKNILEKCLHLHATRINVCLPPCNQGMTPGLHTLRSTPVRLPNCWINSDIQIWFHYPRLLDLLWHDYNNISFKLGLNPTQNLVLIPKCHENIIFGLPKTHTKVGKNGKMVHSGQERISERQNHIYAEDRCSLDTKKEPKSLQIERPCWKMARVGRDLAGKNPSRAGCLYYIFKLRSKWRQQITFNEYLWEIIPILPCFSAYFWRFQVHFDWFLFCCHGNCYILDQMKNTWFLSKPSTCAHTYHLYQSCTINAGVRNGYQGVWHLGFK